MYFGVFYKSKKGSAVISITKSV